MRSGEAFASGIPRRDLADCPLFETTSSSTKREATTDAPRTKPLAAMTTSLRRLVLVADEVT